MIVFSKVSIAFGDRRMLEHASFSIAGGEKVAIRGRSGCGKTTLLKSMVGAVRPTSGTITVNGLELSSANISAIRQQVAFVQQEPALASETARDALLLPFSFKANRAAPPGAQRIAAVLNMLQLPSAILEQQSASLSGGEKQRLAIARAILMGKRIFLADEITSALDPVSKAAVLGFLFANDHTVVSISHDPDWLARCDRLFTLADGQLREEDHAHH